MEKLDDTMELLVATLREVDRGASTVVEGYPTGLRWPHGHVHGCTRTKDRTEDLWADALAARLAGAGTIVDAHARVAYPARERGMGDGITARARPATGFATGRARAVSFLRGGRPSPHRPLARPPLLAACGGGRLWRSLTRSPRAAREFRR
jgi:hypothetical protein